MGGKFLIQEIIPNLVLPARDASDIQQEYRCCVNSLHGWATLSPL